MKQTGRYFIALGCVLCAAILVLDGDVVAAGALSGVQLCLQTVIPSLFCFMVLTGFLINSGLYRLISLPLGPLTKGLFCLPPSMGSVVLLSLIGGYPMGAKSIAGLLEQGRLDRATAQRMLPFCCCAGPSFIITAVGSGMFGSAQAGILLYLVQLFVSILLGAVLGMRERGQQRRMLCDPLPAQRTSDFMPMGQAFVLSVSQAVSAMGQMCGFVILFKALSDILSSTLEGGVLSCLLLGSLEVTNGCLLASGQPLGLCLASCFLSFGGLSVAAQIAGILRGTGLRLRPFFRRHRPAPPAPVSAGGRRLFERCKAGAHRKCQHPAAHRLPCDDERPAADPDPATDPKGRAAFPTKRAVKKSAPRPKGNGEPILVFYSFSAIRCKA